MSLADLPTLLLVPPMNCLVAACAGAFLHRRRAGRVLLAAGLGGLVLLSIPLVSGMLLTGLERDLPTRPDPANPPGAVVILSGNLTEITRDGRPGYTVGDITLERELGGARLARATGLPILVSGGVIRPGAPSLASLMTRSLREDFGLSPRWQEDRSRDTWQNAADTAAIMRQAGVGTVYLVTHAWHMRRALIAFRAAGLRAVAAPVEIDRRPGPELETLLPRISAWRESYYALHEWLGCAWYALRG